MRTCTSNWPASVWKSSRKFGVLPIFHFWEVGFTFPVILSFDFLQKVALPCKKVTDRRHIRLSTASKDSHWPQKNPRRQYFHFGFMSCNEILLFFWEMKDFLEQGKDIKSDCLIWPSIEHGLCQDPENITLNYVRMHSCWIKLPDRWIRQTWDFSKNLHHQIIGTKLLHTKSA